MSTEHPVCKFERVYVWGRLELGQDSMLGLEHRSISTCYMQETRFRGKIWKE